MYLYINFVYVVKYYVKTNLITLQQGFIMSPELIRLKQSLEFETKVALENGLVPNVKSLKAFYDKIATHVTDNLDIRQSPAAELNVNSVLKVIKPVPYLVLSEMTIYKPRGLVTKLSDYAEELMAQCKAIEDIDDRLLQPFSVWVSQAISNPSLLSKIASKGGFETLDVASLRKRLYKHIHLDSEATTGAYGDIIDKNDEWSTVYSVNNKISKLLKGRTVGNVEKKVKRLNSLSSLLITEMENNEEYKSSPSTITKLGDLLYALGLEVEYYATIIHQVNAFHAMLVSNEERLVELMK